MRTLGGGATGDPEWRLVAERAVTVPLPTTTPTTTTVRLTSRRLEARDCVRCRRHAHAPETTPQPGHRELGPQNPVATLREAAAGHGVGSDGTPRVGRPLDADDTVSRDPGVVFDDADRGWQAIRTCPETWLAEVQAPEDERSPWLDRGRFPSEAVREAVLAPGCLLDAETKRTVLRELLPQGLGVVGSDVRHYDLLEAQGFDRIASGEANEYERRLVRARLGRQRAAPLPDLTWVLDLVDWRPRIAMEVMRAYLLAHGWVANDQVIDGIDDALAFVRRHYVQPAAIKGADLLDTLSGRELELLAGALWRDRGFEVLVTPRTRDGGFDVHARRPAAGERTTLLIECRSGRQKQAVSDIRALAGVLADARASGAVLISLGGFTAGPGSAMEFAGRNPQIELIDRTGFSQMLAESWGESWTSSLDRHITDGHQLATGD
jgi:restriction system protein